MALPDRVLEATRAEVTAYGVRRATMTSIARRAGISRATLYRRTPSLDALVNDALVAHFEEVLRQSPPEHDEVTRADLVATTRAILEALSENTFMRALIAHDPELLLPYVVDRLGRSQEIVLERLQAAIEAAQRRATVRPGPPRLLALGTLQALTPYVIGMRLLEPEAPREVWLDEAGRLIDGYLRPDEEPTR